MTVCVGEISPAKSTGPNGTENLFGRQALEDDKRFGCSVTAVTVENVEKAKRLMREDPRIRQEVQDALGFSSGSVIISASGNVALIGPLTT